jgi:hypothetical protein
LGYNPVQHLVGSGVLSHLSASSRQILIGREYFPSLIAVPFRDGLHAVFDFAIVACLVAAAASWSRGGRYVHAEDAHPPDGLADQDEPLEAAVSR